MTGKQKGIVALVFVAVAWGILPLFPRFLSQSFSLYQQLYLRIGAAFVFSLALFSKQLSLKRIVKMPAKDFVLLILRGLSYWIIGAAAMTSALLLTKVSNVMFIQAIPMTAIFGILFLHEKLTKAKIVLVTLSFIGVLIVSVNDVSGLIHFGLGEFLSLLSIFAFDFSLVGRKWHTDYLSDKEISTSTLFLSFVLAFAASFVFKEGLPVWNGNPLLIVVVFCSGLIIAGMNFFLNYGFKRVEAIISSPILSLETVLSIVFAFFVFQEVPSLKGILGGALILVSSILMQIVEYRKDKKLEEVIGIANP